MDAIATSAREQSVGLAEVNTAVNQMDQVTQQNAAMVEETNAASATLANEACRLRELISQFVLDEAAAGDAAAATQRLDALRDVTLLDVTEDAILLAGDLVAGGGLPAKARVDALHVAMAAVHGMDFLLTWNCKHIANAATRGTIEDLCRAAGFEPPIICTHV